MSNIALLKRSLNNQTGTINIVLPTKERVPRHFHITDVGVVTYDMIDCGGWPATIQYVQAQLWLGKDTHHLMSAHTLGSILNASSPIFDRFEGIELAPIHIEYQINNTISKYVVESVDAGYDKVTITLDNIRAVCLELERNPKSTMCGNDTPSSSCC